MRYIDERFKNSELFWITETSLIYTSICRIAGHQRRVKRSLYNNWIRSTGESFFPCARNKRIGVNRLGDPSLSCFVPNLGNKWYVIRPPQFPRCQMSSWREKLAPLVFLFFYFFIYFLYELAVLCGLFLSFLFFFLSLFQMGGVEINLKFVYTFKGSAYNPWCPNLPIYTFLFFVSKHDWFVLKLNS